MTTTAPTDFNVSLPNDVAKSLRDLAKHRKVTEEELLAQIVTQCVQKYAPESGRFPPNLEDDMDPVVRCANALLVQAIDNGRYAIDSPTAEGGPLSTKDANGKPFFLPQNMESWVRRRFEEMAAMQAGTFPIVHNGCNYTVHVVFSGWAKTHKMHLWIEEG